MGIWGLWILSFCLFLGYHIPGQPLLNGLLFFLSSLSIGIIGMILSYRTRHEIFPIRENKYGWIALFIALSVLFLSVLQITKNHEIQVKQSDIIPQIQVLVDRFLRVEFPYRMISEWGYELFPTYLPLQWLPYCIPDMMGIDFRVFATLIFALVCIYFFRRSTLSDSRGAVVAIFVILLIVFRQADIFGVTVEIMIAAYYLWMAFHLKSKSIWLRGSGLLLCLLSRYSIVLWVPLYIFLIWKMEGAKNALKISMVVMAGLALIYGPFLVIDPDIYAKGYRYHHEAALGEWKGQYWQAIGEKPHQLFQGLGMAAWIYEYASGSLENRLHVLQKIHVICSALACLMIGLLYLKKRPVNEKLFILSSLQIYLTFFYHWIQIPYSYLFLVPLMTSIPLMMEMSKGKNDLNMSR